MEPLTLTTLVQRLDEKGAPAVCARNDGAWNTPESAVPGDVRGLAAALRGYGLTPGARAAVLGTEGYGPLRDGLAVIAAGAVLVPLGSSLSDDALRRALSLTGAVHAIASDERQLARILALRPDLPALELVLLSSAAPSERRPAAMLVAAAIEVGTSALAEEPELLQAAAAEGERAAACLLVDAEAPAREVTRPQLLALTHAVAQAVGVREGSTVLCAVPGLWRLAAAVAVLSRGATLALPESGTRPDAGLDQRPADAVLLDVAGLERLRRAWIEDIDAKPWMARAATRWAMRQGQDVERRRWKYRLAEQVALRGLRNKLGGRATALEVIANERGGTSREVEAFFASVGLPIRYFSPGAGPSLAR